MIRPALVAAALLLVACNTGEGGGPGDPGGTAAPPFETAAPSASPPPAVEACTPARPHDDGDFERALQSGGLDREYLLHVPPGYDGAAEAPVVIAYHGFASDKQQLAAYSRLSAVSDEHGFILVFPDAVRVPKTWHMVEGAAVDDVAFTLDLLATLEAELCTDDERVFATGHSNGGGMALFLACQRPDVVAAVGVVSAVFPICSAPVPMIAFHGTEDFIVPFEGGPPPLGPDIDVRFPPIRQAASNWARNLGCDGLPLISRLSPEVELSTFMNCPGAENVVLLYSVIGGGHTWPGGLPIPVLGHTTEEISASERMWEFFVEHTSR